MSPSLHAFLTASKKAFFVAIGAFVQFMFIDPVFIEDSQIEENPVGS